MASLTDQCTLKRKRDELEAGRDVADGSADDNGTIAPPGISTGNSRSSFVLSEDIPNEVSEQAPRSEPYSRQDEPDWRVAESKGSRKKRKLPKQDSEKYPVITHSANARLQTHVKINDLQSLVLYLLADGQSSPQWVAIRNMGKIRKVVVLMVPGLESGMFNGKIQLDGPASSRQEETDIGAAADAETQKEAVSNNIEPVDRGRINLSPDDYYPVKLVSEKLPSPLKPLADIFPHLWPVKTPGDDKHSKIHSPLSAMLVAPLPKTREEKNQKGPQPPRVPKDWENSRTHVSRFLAKQSELEENEYVLHPAHCSSADEKETQLLHRSRLKNAAEDGWVDSTVADTSAFAELAKDVGHDLATGCQVIAMDCEMVKVEGDKFALARISLVDWDGRVILDEYVRPDEKITDYVTMYSGITKEKLDPVKTTLSDIQARLLELLTPTTILVGHSLNSDLNALKLTHPHIIDTAIIYPHPRGPPLKSSLKWLAQKYLQREIQKGHGIGGHDSIEDARACLDLLKQKCEKGPRWGTSEASGESIFKRLGRARRPKHSKISGATEEFRTGAVVDWGEPKRGQGAAAEVSIGCENDADVVHGVRAALTGESRRDVPAGGVDFVWARLRELEAVRGWWNRTKTIDNANLLARVVAQQSSKAESSSSSEPSPVALGEAVARTVNHIAEIYEALPLCTAFIVYSGSGDPLELTRLQQLHQQFKREYQFKKWDELSVQWTDVEEQAIKSATRQARMGIGFVTVK